MLAYFNPGGYAPLYSGIFLIAIKGEDGAGLPIHNTCACYAVSSSSRSLTFSCTGLGLGCSAY